jgi:hypothetical protein
MQVLLLPGDLALNLLMRHAPALAAFFELGSDDYRGTVSLVFSVLFWLAVVGTIGVTLNVVRNADRWLTAWLGGHLREGRRLIRVGLRMIHSRIGQLRRRSRERHEVPLVAELRLDSFDSAVLRCFGAVGDLHVLAADEVAQSLRTSMRRVESALGRLRNHRLVEPAFGTDRGRDTHQITRAGQIYLLER